MSVGDKSVIFLLGAGCSSDADVPMSSTMISNIEEYLKVEKKWKDYSELYYYVKHTIEYGNKISGNFKDFNIESLLMVLHALSEHRKSLLYPFTTGYNSDLMQYAGKDFVLINHFIEVIEEELPKWVTIGSYSKASYYKGFERFQNEFNHAVRIFSLNYDLCIEENIKKLETGFLNDEPWDGNRFSKIEGEEETPIYLYKLHGSIDWERKNNILRRSKQQGIKPDIIFGTDVKLQAIDPYLFYLYEFRKYALNAKVLIIIGYSFNDSHINKLITQALETDSDKKIINITLCPDIYSEKENVLKKLEFEKPELHKEKIIIQNARAKDFLENTLTVDYVSSFLTQSELPF